MNENHIRPKAFDGGLRCIEIVLRTLPVGEHVRRLVELQIALQEKAAVDTGLLSLSIRVWPGGSPWFVVSTSVSWPRPRKP